MSDKSYEWSLAQAALSLYTQLKAASSESAREDKGETIAPHETALHLQASAAAERSSPAHTTTTERGLTCPNRSDVTCVPEHDHQRQASRSNQRNLASAIKVEKLSENSPPALPSVTEEEASAIQAVEDAIRLLSESDKSAYFEAKQEAPELIQTESNPLWFVKFEQGNTWSAAKRLATYWRERCNAFKERAMKPLNQTGEGALTKRDVAAIGSGYHAILPPDKNGRTVVFLDPSRHVRKDLRALKRHMFYWAFLMMGNPRTFESGFVLILRIDQSSFDLFSKSGRERQALVLRAFPYKPYALHLIPNTDRPRSMLSKGIPHLLNLFLSVSGRFWHSCDNNSQIIEALAEHGITKESLPTSIGGDWSYDNIATWQEQRIRIEWNLPSHQEESSTGELTSEERQERKRRYNILHARRKRHKDRLSVQAMNQQITGLNSEQDELTSEKKTLRRAQCRANSLLCQGTKKVA
mmetsp:Transcript_7803/g.21759  ORF Transcript_7803/g.21759 Transcript_7803/m.21759 type:complete len:468 (+) Transcript_7803:43-1446(+)